MRESEKAAKGTGAGASTTETSNVRVRRVRKASEQVADQLRSLILGGELPSGSKLPTEQILAQEFGVSRATIREALTGLATEGLLRTAKGVHGGSFVTTPSPDHVSDALNLAVTLLSQGNRVTLDELLEVRDCLEIPATRLAAERRSDHDLAQMAAAIPDHPLALPVATQFDYNRDFHRAVLDASNNTLLVIAAAPVFSVLQKRMERSKIGSSFHEKINQHHRAIDAAVRAGDASLAEREMREHLLWLKPQYESIWEEPVEETDLQTLRRIRDLT
jgi:DNA-binding FadR family transcriptional regulator